LEDYLNTCSEPERSALLGQLLLLDWEYRRRAGDDPRDDYLTRFPGDSTLIEAVGQEMSQAADNTIVQAGGPNAGPRDVLDNRRVGGSDNPSHADSGAFRYDLVREVGHGGIGVVFRGRDRRLGRELAVKVLRANYRDQPEACRRFVDEARVGSQLQHPAIVPIYELGEFADGSPFLTMKLVEGKTLAALLEERNARGRSSADAAEDLPHFLGIFEQVCQAMAYAHARGVIHRDLKPANIMVGAFGEVQVMDWGFAKQLPNAHSQNT